MNPAATMLLGLAMKAASRRFSSPLELADWRWEGAFPLSAKGRAWHLALDGADPLRLRHVPTGRCLCPAWREFDTDLASIPDILRKALRRSKALHLRRDSFPRSAAFHDCLYGAHACHVVEGGRAWLVPVTRAQADAVLYVGMACEGATVADGLAWHAAVRAAGRRHWRIPPGAPQWPALFGQLKGSEVEELKSSEVEELKSSPSTSQPFNPSPLQPFNRSTPQPFNRSSESPDGGNLPAESPVAPAVMAGPSGDSPSSDIAANPENNPDKTTEKT